MPSRSSIEMRGAHRAAVADLVDDVLVDRLRAIAWRRACRSAGTARWRSASAVGQRARGSTGSAGTM